jgi:hypothetical protein
MKYAPIAVLASACLGVKELQLPRFQRRLILPEAFSYADKSRKSIVRRQAHSESVVMGVIIFFIFGGQAHSLSPRSERLCPYVLSQRLRYSAPVNRFQPTTQVHTRRSPRFTHFGKITCMVLRPPLPQTRPGVCEQCSVWQRYQSHFTGHAEIYSHLAFVL